MSRCSTRKERESANCFVENGMKGSDREIKEKKKRMERDLEDKRESDRESKREKEA